MNRNLFIHFFFLTLITYNVLNRSDISMFPISYNFDRNYVLVNDPRWRRPIGNYFEHDYGSLNRRQRFL